MAESALVSSETRFEANDPKATTDPSPDTSQAATVVPLNPEA